MKPEIKERIEKIKRGEVPEGYKKTKAGIASSKWLCKKVKYLATEVVAGATPSTKHEEYWNGHIPWMSSGEINNRFITKTERMITQAGYDSSSTKYIPPESVLVALAGQGQTRGRVAMNLIKLCTNQSLAAIIPNNKTYPYFLFYNLENRYNELRKMSTGEGGRGGLNLQIIKNIYVNIPQNYEEQQKIAEILSTWDKAIELKEKLIEEKKKQKKGLMQLLLTGKKRLPGFKGEWKEVRFGQVFSFIKKEPVDNPQDYYLLTVRLHLKGVEPTNKKPNITKKGRPYYLREPNEILIGRQNFHNGGIGIVPKSMSNYIASNAISSLSIKEGDLKFLYYYISNSDFYKKVGHIIGGTGQKEISESMMKKLKLKIPQSLEEQKEIGNILTYADKEIELLEQELEALKLQKKGLMQLLLTGIVRVIDN